MRLATPPRLSSRRARVWRGLGVRPIVIAEVTTRRHRDGPEEKNAPGGSHEKAAKCSRRHSLDAPSRERREHVVTRGGLRRGRREGK